MSERDAAPDGTGLQAGPSQGDSSSDNSRDDVDGRMQPTTSSQHRHHGKGASDAGGAGRYDMPDAYAANLDELAAGSPVENPAEARVYRHESLEERRRSWDEEERGGDTGEEGAGAAAPTTTVSRLMTHFYTVSYLVLFSILGTLARLGLQAITYYPGAPVAFSSVWPNFAGCLIMGFLAEDRMLFRPGWVGTPVEYEPPPPPELAGLSEGAVLPTAPPQQQPSPLRQLSPATKSAHLAAKKAIPLYIGLATGFCGSFTSFSSFMRDAFLALSNDLVAPDVPGADDGDVTTTPRNGGYSFMAVLAVLIATVGLALAGLFLGAHAAIAFESWRELPPFHLLPRRRQTPSPPDNANSNGAVVASSPQRQSEKQRPRPRDPRPRLAALAALDNACAFLAWGCWLGAALLTALPPDRFSAAADAETWRGRATFAILFAPPGCLLRFALSLRLNGVVPAFPLGTFAANALGTAVLGMAWDLAHAGVGGIGGGLTACQVLQGVEDGFCGCLTTVSTWAAELASLRRRNAYRYGAVSVGATLALLVAIMGSDRWARGWDALKCSH